MQLEKYLIYQDMFLIIYKTQLICNKAILGNSGTLKFVPDCYKNQEIFNKAIDNYSHALEFVPECYKTQIMCDKFVNT